MPVMHYIGFRTIVVKNMKCYNGNDFLALGNNVKPRKWPLQLCKEQHRKNWLCGTPSQYKACIHTTRHLWETQGALYYFANIVLKHDDQGNLQKMSTWAYSPQKGRVHDGRVEVAGGRYWGWSRSWGLTSSWTIIRSGDSELQITSSRNPQNSLPVTEFLQQGYISWTNQNQVGRQILARGIFTIFQTTTDPNVHLPAAIILRIQFTTDPR